MAADKTKVSIGIVVGGLVVYALYRNYQAGKESGASDQLPVQSSIEYFHSPEVNSVSDGITDSITQDNRVSETITNQSGRQILYNGQPMTYPMV